MQDVTELKNTQQTFSKVIADEIRLSPAAHQQMKKLVEEENDIEGVRIFVQGGGCGGMNYSMTFATQRFDHDCVLERDGLNVYVDAVAMNFLEGVEIDYVSTATGATFTFKNVFQAVGGAGTCSRCGAAAGSCGV